MGARGMYFVYKDSKSKIKKKGKRVGRVEGG